MRGERGCLWVGCMRWLLQRGKIGEAVFTRKWLPATMYIRVILIAGNNVIGMKGSEIGREWLAMIQSNWEALCWVKITFFGQNIWEWLQSKQVCKFGQNGIDNWYAHTCSPPPRLPHGENFANRASEQVSRHVCWLGRNLEFIWVRRQWVRAGPAPHTGYFSLLHSITIQTFSSSSLSSNLIFTVNLSLITFTWNCRS